MFNKLNSKIAGHILLVACTCVLLILLCSGCSSRREKPVILNDSTIVYPAKSETGLELKITLSNKISKKTGKPINAASVFKLKDNSKLFATVDLGDQTEEKNKKLMFHIDWIDSSGNSLYKKRIDFSPNDSSSSLISSISISPQKRKVGNYTVRVYLFRELIAEKKFRLVNFLHDSTTVKKKDITKKKSETEKKVKVEKTLKPKVKSENIKANLVLCRKVSKKTGKPIGSGTTFTIKDKANVKAIVSFEKKEIKTNEQMKFYFNWIGPDGKLFYKKRIIYTTSNPSFSISNSISISPEKRKPGTYTIQILYKKKIVAEQKFELVLPTE